MLKSNIDALEIFYSDIAEYCLNVDKYNENDGVVESTITKDGKTVLRLSNAGKKRYVGNAYYYNSDQKQVIDMCIGINDYAVLVIYGFGTGDIIRDIIKTLPQHITYIVLEPSIELFSYVLTNLDISDVISNDRLKIFVDGINWDMLDAAIWKSIDETNYKISKTVSLPGYQNIFPEQYKCFSQMFSTHIEHCASDILSGKFHSIRDVENDIYNLEHVLNCCCVDQFIDLFPVDYPAVIISAGPSLEKNVELIRELKGRLFLAAVDSVLPYLLSINIIPDLAISVSPNKDDVLKELYDTSGIDNIPFAIDTSVTYTGIRKVSKCKLIYVSSSSPYYKEIFALANHSIDKLKSGGSVSSIAFSLLYEWGYRSFVFVGLDLALTGDKVYAGSENDYQCTSGNRLVIDGYYGDKVYTLNTYKIHLDWFEAIAQSHKDIIMYNATEGGAMVHGMKNCSLKEMVDRYREVSFNYESIIKKVNEAVTGETKRVVYYRFLHSIDNLDKLYKIYGRACELMESILRLLSLGEGRDDSEIIEKHKEVNNVISICTEMPESYYLERIVGDRHNNILEDIYITDNNQDEEYRRILNKLYKYCLDMRDSVDQVKGLFAEMVDNVEKKLREKEECLEVPNDIYAANLTRMKEVYGIDADRMSVMEGDIAENETIIPETEVAKNGTKITLLNCGERRIYLNSRYNPEDEADKFVLQYNEITDYSVCLFFGLGNGIVARKLAETLGNHVSLIFYEPFPELFVHVMQNYDITDIIDNSRIRIFVKGINDDELDIYLHDVVTEANYRYTFYDALPKYKMLCLNDFEYIYNRFNDAVQSVRNNIETVKYQSGVDSRNNILNLEFLRNCCCEEQLRGVFDTEMPVVLVAAGPSLKKNIDELKKLKGKLLIIAVDTVAKYMMKNNVRPDIVITVDPNLKEVVFEELRDENLICAYSTGASYEVLKATGQGRKIVISSRSAYYDKLMGLSGHHMYQLNSGGSVATTAFAFAQSLGYTSYILVGQDLAFENGKRYADDNLGVVDGRNDYELVDGYYGDKVASPKDLKLYLNWYEMMARSYPDFTIINATEGGAKIKGTIQKRLADIAEEYKNVNIDYEDIIRCQEPLFDNVSYDRFRNYVSNSKNRLSDMAYKLKYGLHLIDSAMVELKKGGINSINIRNIHEKINELINECAIMEESYFVDGVIADKQADVLADIYEQADDPSEEYIRILTKLKEYVKDMVDAIDEVVDMFSDAINNMK